MEGLSVIGRDSIMSSLLFENIPLECFARYYLNVHHLQHENTAYVMLFLAFVT